MLATVGSSSKSELEFWDLDFNLDDTKGKDSSSADWGSSVQLIGTADHYGVTDVEWDPSGRYLATSASAWTHTVSVFVIMTLLGFSFLSSSRTATLSGTSEDKKL